jgi:hypothetical protein
MLPPSGNNASSKIHRPRNPLINKGTYIVTILVSWELLLIGRIFGEHGISFLDLVLRAICLLTSRPWSSELTNWISPIHATTKYRCMDRDRMGGHKRSGVPADWSDDNTTTPNYTTNEWQICTCYVLGDSLVCVLLRDLWEVFEHSMTHE